MYYSLDENCPYLVDLPAPVHIREVINEMVSDIRRKHRAQTVTLADLREQIRDRRIYAGVRV